jgi:uncharacterized membrane protein
VAPEHADRIRRDSSEASWEEAAQTMAHESGTTVNTVLLMFIAGVVGTVGLTTNALHLVIGAMVIAPGFAPITRITMGLVAGHPDWKLGLRDLVVAYAAIIAGAICADLLVMGLGEHPEGGASSYLPKGVLMSYWLTIKGTSVIVTTVGAIAGGLVIITNRSVLTNGVMIALALVPSACMIGMGIANGDADLVLGALRRWGMEVGIVSVCSTLVFIWKRTTVQRRVMRG